MAALDVSHPAAAAAQEPTILELIVENKAHSFGKSLYIARGSSGCWGIPGLAPQLDGSYNLVPDEKNTACPCSKSSCDYASSILLGFSFDYPWDALRWLLARKVEEVLLELWMETPDLDLDQENETFENSAVEPLTRSLLEPRREGPPFTIQRLCELLIDPHVYKSTRKYLFALQRAIVVTMTEESIMPPSNGAPAAMAPVVGDVGGAPALKKRKLPPELANGVVSE